MVFLAGDAEPPATISAPSSRGLGRRPLKAVTPVRIRSGLHSACSAGGATRLPLSRFLVCCGGTTPHTPRCGLCPRGCGSALGRLWFSVFCRVWGSPTPPVWVSPAGVWVGAGAPLVLGFLSGVGIPHTPRCGFRPRGCGVGAGAPPSSAIVRRRVGVSAVGLAREVRHVRGGRRGCFACAGGRGQKLMSLRAGDSFAPRRRRLVGRRWCLSGRCGRRGPLGR